jgi:hypothetical protein
VIILLLIIVGVCALAAAAATFGRTHRPDEVERFHRARAMTTEWSRRYTGQPALPAQSQGEQVDGMPVEQRLPEPADR